MPYYDPVNFLTNTLGLKVEYMKPAIPHSGDSGNDLDHLTLFPQLSMHHTIKIVEI